VEDQGFSVLPNQVKYLIFLGFDNVAFIFITQIVYNLGRDTKHHNLTPLLPYPLPFSRAMPRKSAIEDVDNSNLDWANAVSRTC